MGRGACFYVHNTLKSQKIDLDCADCVAVQLKTESVNVAVSYVCLSLSSLTFENSKLMRGYQI